MQRALAASQEENPDEYRRKIVACRDAVGSLRLESIDGGPWRGQRWISRWRRRRRLVADLLAVATTVAEPLAAVAIAAAAILLVA